MIVKDTTISFNNRTEPNIMQLVVDAMTSIDPRITCDTTVTDQYSDTSNTATFNFSVDGAYDIQFKRYAINSTSSHGFSIALYINGAEYGKLSQYWWRNDTPYDSLHGDFRFRVKSIVGSGFIGIWMGVGAWASYAFTIPLPHTYMTIYTTDGNGNKFGSYYLNTEDFSYCLDIMQGSFCKSDGSVGYTAAYTSMNFIDAPGTISYIQHLPLLQSGTVLFDIPELVACSNISIGTSIALDNGNIYLAIGNHTLVPLTV